MKYLTLAFLLAFTLSAHAAGFDSSICPREITVQYSGLYKTSPGLVGRTQNNSLTIQLSLVDDVLLNLYKVCLYGGNDTGSFPPAGYKMYSAELDPTHVANEFTLRISSQHAVSGSSFLGILTFADEVVVLSSPQSLRLKAPVTARAINTVEDTGNSDAHYPPARVEVVGIASRVQVSAN